MKVSDCSIPDGTDFLPHTSRQYLTDCQKNEKNAKARLRLLAYVMRKDERSIRDIGGLLNKPYSTVRDWLRRAAEDGIRRRHDRKIPGPRAKLDGRQTGLLKRDLVAGPQACGLEYGVWTAPVIIRHVKNRFGVEYSSGGIYHLLRRMGFSWQAPRPLHPKSALKEEQEEFKKKPGA